MKISTKKEIKKIINQKKLHPVPHPLFYLLFIFFLYTYPSFCLDFYFITFNLEGDPVFLPLWVGEMFWVFFGEIKEVLY